MVTVNYVFLCAFLKTNKQKNDKKTTKKKISGKGCWDVEAADVHVRERETFFFFWWSIMETECVSEKEKKWKKQKKYMNIFFFLKQYISV